MQYSLRAVGVLFTVCLAGLNHAAAQQIEIEEVREPVQFEEHILPILRNNCLACHSRQEAQGDLVLETVKELLKGGDSGPAAVPGKASASLLLKLTARQQEPVMPPPDNDVAANPLTSRELGLLKAWINQGARGGAAAALLSPKKWLSLPPAVGPVHAVALTADGQYAACTRGNQLYLYHVPTGRLVTQLADPRLAPLQEGGGIAHGDLVQSLAFNADGNLLASGSFREVRLWRRPRDVERTRHTTGAPVTALAVSPDRTWIAATDADHSVQLWHAGTGKPGPTLSGHSDRVTAVCFAPTGSMIATASLDGSIRTWTLPDGKPAGRIETPTPINALQFVLTAAPSMDQPAPLLLVSGGKENELRTWRLPTALPEPVPFGQSVTRLVSSQDRRFTASISAAGAICVQQVPGDRIIKTWTPDPKPVSIAFVAASKDGSAAPHVVTGSSDGTFSVWELPEGRLHSQWRGAGGPVTALSAAPDGTSLVSGTGDGQLAVWSSSVVAKTFEGSTGAAVDSLEVNAARNMVAIIGTHDEQPAVFVRRLTDGAVIHTLTNVPDKLTAVSLSRDGTRVAISGQDATTVHNLQSSDTPVALQTDTASHTTLAFSPDGNTLVAGSADGTVTLWKTTDGTLGQTCTGHSGRIVSVGFSRNQPYSASVDKSVRFWNPADGAQTRSFDNPTPIAMTTLSTDEQRLAVAGDDHAIRLYETSTGKSLHTLIPHATPITQVHFSADGTRLVSTSTNGDISVWDTATGFLIEDFRDQSATVAAFAQENKHLITGTRDGLLRSTSLRFARSLTGSDKPVTGLLVHSNGQSVYAASEDGSLRGFTLSTGQAVFTATHGAPITALAKTADDRVLGTASANGQVRLWQANGSAYGPQRLSATGPVSALAFALDGSQILVAHAGDHPAVSVFDLQSGQLRQRFTEHGGPVSALHVDGTGRFLSAGEETLRWQSHALKTFAGHGGEITSLAAVPGRPNEVLSGSRDATARRWNLTNGQQVGRYNHGGPVTSVAVRPDARRVATASENHTAKLWDINGRQVAEMRGDLRLKALVARRTQQNTAAGSRVNAAKSRLDAAEKILPVRNEAANKLGETLAAANKDVEMKQAAFEKARGDKESAEKLAIETSQAARQAEVARSQAETAAAEADALVARAQEQATRLAAASAATPTSTSLKEAAAEAQAALQQAQASAKQLKTAIQEPTQAAQAAMKMAADAAGKAGEMQKPYTDALAALETAQSAQNLAAQQHATATRDLEKARADVPLAKKAFANAEANRDAAAQRLEEMKQQSRAAERPLLAVAFSADGRLLGTAGAFQSAHTWDGETGEAVAAYAGHSGTISGVCFLDETLVTAADDQTVRLWELNPGWELERTIGALDKPDVISHRVTSLDFNPDSTLLLVGGGTPSRSGELQVFAVSDGKRRFYRPQAHDDVIYAARFDPQGNRIASAAADKYVRTFDLTSGDELRRFEGHTGYVLGVDWKGDGQNLASAGADNTIKVWNAETGDRIRSIPNFGKHVTAVRYVGETDNIVSSCGDQRVRLHTATSGRNFRNLSGPQAWLHCVDVTPDSRVVAAGDAAGVLHLWDGTNGRSLRRITVGKTE